MIPPDVKERQRILDRWNEKLAKYTKRWFIGVALAIVLRLIAVSGVLGKTTFMVNFEMAFAALLGAALLWIRTIYARCPFCNDLRLDLMVWISDIDRCSNCDAYLKK